MKMCDTICIEEGALIMKILFTEQLIKTAANSERGIEYNAATSKYNIKVIVTLNNQIIKWSDLYYYTSF